MVLALIRAGKGRNEIARELGISAASVTGIAPAGSFDRSATRAATEAHKADLGEIRARVARKMIEKSEQLLDMIDQPHVVFSFGGRDNTFASEVLDRPPTADIRNLMTSAAIGAQRSLELTRFDSDQGAGKAGSLLAALAEGFTEAARLLDDVDQADTEPTDPEPSDNG